MPVTPPLQPNQGIPATPPPQPNQGVPVTLPPQPDQLEIPPDLMELNILEDIPDLLNVPEEVFSYFEAWAQSVLDYLW